MLGDNVKMEAAGSSEMSVIFNILLVSTPDDFAVFMATAVTASDIAYCKQWEIVRFGLEFCEKQILHKKTVLSDMHGGFYALFAKCEKFVRMEQRGSNWTDFHEIRCLKIFFENLQRQFNFH